MNRFVEFTIKDGKRVLIGIENIEYIFEGKNDPSTTLITTISGESVEVDGTFYDVRAKVYNETGRLYR